MITVWDTRISFLTLDLRHAAQLLDLQSLLGEKKSSGRFLGQPSVVHFTSTATGLKLLAIFWQILSKSEAAWGRTMSV